MAESDPKIARTLSNLSAALASGDFYGALASFSVSPAAVCGELELYRIVTAAFTHGSVLHVAADASTTVGDRCVIGHRVHLEGCTIEDDCLIGSGSVVLHHVVVGRGSLVGAQALVPNRTIIPPRSRALGVPARVSEGVIAEGEFDYAVERYVRNSHRYRAELRRLD